MKKILLAAVCLLLAGCGAKTAENSPPAVWSEPAVSVETVTEQMETPQREQPEISDEELLSGIPVAEIEGEPLSPDAEHRLETVGKSEVCISGMCLPEVLRLVDQKGNVLWEDSGYPRQVVEWSPDSRYAAIYCAARTWGFITVVDTFLQQSMEVTLPDGSSFGEYNFLEEMTWEQETDYDHTLIFTLCGNETKEYGFYPHQWENVLSGDTFYREVEVLEEEYDFTRDGIPEEVSIVTVRDPDGEHVAWFEVRVEQEGEKLWHQDAATSHAGYNTVLALRTEEGDCLMNYHPGMGMGWGNYSYRIFSLDETGGEVTAAENSVQFDVNFRAGIHERFEPAEIAAFLREAYGYLEQARLILSTEGGLFREASGDEFFWSINHFFELPRDLSVWEEHLAAYEKNAWIS